MKVNALIKWHIAGWGLISIFFLMPFFLYGVTNRFLYGIITFLLNIGAFYINLLVILPHWIDKRKISVVLAGWLGLIVVCSLIMVGLNQIFSVYAIKNYSLKLELLNAFLRSCLVIGISIAASIAYRSVYDWFENEKVKRQMETLQLKTELAFLKSQINPHFLFNTLNNIYTLAFQQSDKTADAVAKLSGMMRYLLYDSRDEYVPFNREIDCINQLIELQQLRIRGKMALIYEVKVESDSSLIAPLLLLPFVENLFKHGELSEIQDPAVIRISLVDGLLEFYTRNKINRHLKDETKGIGFPNVVRRMELLYPDKFTINRMKNETHFSVNLTIQIN